jgi:hypothetical protein
VPLVRRTPTRALRFATGLYVGLQLAYGLANVTNDEWYEQVVKRGWVGTSVPDVLEPTISLAWLGIVLAAALLTAAILGIGKNDGGASSAVAAGRYRGVGSPP